jgi:hypothetical protein
MIDNSIVQFMNNIDCTILNNKIVLCDKLRTRNEEFNVSHNFKRKCFYIQISV